MEEPRALIGPRGTLVGVVHHPAPGVGINACAIFMHGYFSSDHIGPSRLYVLISRLLANNGYSVWRFDCYGIGDSEGDYEAATYWSELEDYAAILGTAVAEEGAESVVIVAHSMGTSLAVRLAALDRRIGKLILLSPSLGKITWPENLFSVENFTDLSTEGATVRKALLTKQSVLQDIQEEDVFEICHEVQAETTIIYGSSDEYYSLESAKRTALALRANNFIQVPGADHNFLSEDSREALLMTVEKWIHDRI